MSLFDKEAIHYDDWYQTKMGKFVDDTETECAFSLFDTKSGTHILDVGCGTGNFSIKMARKGAIITGIDISEKMLSIAQQKASNENLDIKFLKMDSNQLEFQDEYFDGVVSMAAIEFIPEAKKMIDEMFRVCKKGGYILLGTINRESEWGKLYQDPEFQKSTPVFKSAILRSPNELGRYKKDAIIQVKECLFISPNTAEAEISKEKEEKLASTKQGGFFCILWVKR